MENIQTIIQNLPQSLQEIIASEMWRSKVQEIAQKYLITNEEDERAIELEVLYVLISVQSGTDLALGIAERTHIDTSRAQQIADAIIQKVLNPIEAHVKKKEGIVDEPPAKTVVKVPVQITPESEQVIEKPETTPINQTFLENVEQNSTPPAPKQEEEVPHASEETHPPQNADEALNRLDLLNDFENPLPSKAKHEPRPPRPVQPVREIPFSKPTEQPSPKNETPKEPAPKPKQGYDGNDPYREPIE